MESNLKNVLTGIVSDNDLKEQLENLNSISEVYDLVKGYGYKGTKQQLEKEIQEELIEVIGSKEMEDYDLSTVAGGFGKGSKAAGAVALAFLTLTGTVFPGSGSRAHAAEITETSKIAKVSASEDQSMQEKTKKFLETRAGKAVLIALGITTIAGGTAIVGGSVAATVLAIKKFSVKSPGGKTVEIRNEDQKSSALGFKLSAICFDVLNKKDVKETSKTDKQIREQAVKVIKEQGFEEQFKDEIQKLSSDNLTVKEFCVISLNTMKTTGFVHVKGPDGKDVFGKDVKSIFETPDISKMDIGKMKEAFKLINNRGIESKNTSKSSTGKSKGKSKGKSAEKSTEASTGTPNETPKGVPTVVPTQTPKEAPKEAPKETPKGAPIETQPKPVQVTQEEIQKLKDFIAEADKKLGPVNEANTFKDLNELLKAANITIDDKDLEQKKVKDVISNVFNLRKELIKTKSIEEAAGLNKALASFGNKMTKEEFDSSLKAAEEDLIAVKRAIKVSYVNQQIKDINKEIINLKEIIKPEGLQEYKAFLNGLKDEDIMATSRDVDERVLIENWIDTIGLKEDVYKKDGKLKTFLDSEVGKQVVKVINSTCMNDIYRRVDENKKSSDFESSKVNSAQEIATILNNNLTSGKKKLDILPKHTDSTTLDQAEDMTKITNLIRLIKGNITLGLKNGTATTFDQTEFAKSYDTLNNASAKQELNTIMQSLKTKQVDVLGNKVPMLSDVINIKNDNPHTNLATILKNGNIEIDMSLEDAYKKGYLNITGDLPTEKKKLSELSHGEAPKAASDTESIPPVDVSLDQLADYSNKYKTFILKKYNKVTTKAFENEVNEKKRNAEGSKDNWLTPDQAKIRDESMEKLEKIKDKYKKLSGEDIEKNGKLPQKSSLGRNATKYKTNIGNLNLTAQEWETISPFEKKVNTILLNGFGIDGTDIEDLKLEDITTQK